MEEEWGGGGMGGGEVGRGRERGNTSLASWWAFFQLFNADREGNLCLLYAVRDSLEVITPICAFCVLLEII